MAIAVGLMAVVILVFIRPLKIFGFSYSFGNRCLVWQTGYGMSTAAPGLERSDRKANRRDVEKSASLKEGYAPVLFASVAK